MARNKGTLPNIDNSNLANYPNGRIKDNTGAGNGTPVNEFTKGDIHEFFDKALRLYGIPHNGIPDNETNGYQLIDAVVALASKNDFNLDLTSVSSGGGLELNVPLKLGKLLPNETFILKAAADKTTETNVKGTLDNVSKTVTFLGDFKSGEYVRMVNTPSAIILVRLVDYFNLESAASELLFLKAASQVEENAGLIDTKGTTPLTNKIAFIDRVNGNTESINYLASASRNGLLSKEQYNIIANIGQSSTKNTGFFDGLDSGGMSVGDNFVVGGNIVSAVVLYDTSGATRIRVTLQNAMDNLNYFVRIHIQSKTPDVNMDNDRNLATPIFRPISADIVDIVTDELSSVTQNLKVHLEVVQY